MAVGKEVCMLEEVCISETTQEDILYYGGKVDYVTKTAGKRSAIVSIDGEEFRVRMRWYGEGKARIVRVTSGNSARLKNLLTRHLLMKENIEYYVYCCMRHQAVWFRRCFLGVLFLLIIKSIRRCMVFPAFPDLMIIFLGTIIAVILCAGSGKPYLQTYEEYLEECREAEEEFGDSPIDPMDLKGSYKYFFEWLSDRIGH